MNTPGLSTSTWQDMECLLSLWLSPLQWTTGATAQTECKERGVAKRTKHGGRMDDGAREAGVPAVILAVSATVDSTSCGTSEASIQRG